MNAHQSAQISVDSYGVGLAETGAALFLLPPDGGILAKADDLVGTMRTVKTSQLSRHAA